MALTAETASAGPFCYCKGTKTADWCMPKMGELSTAHNCARSTAHQLCSLSVV